MMKTLVGWFGLALLASLSMGCSTRENPQPTPEKAPATAEGRAAPKGVGAKTKTIWKASVVHPDGDEVEAGQLALEKGVLSVVSARNEENRKYLEEAVESVNALDQLLKSVAPGADEPRYTSKSKVITRDQPEFEEALVEKLRRDHLLNVKPAK